MSEPRAGEIEERIALGDFSVILRRPAHPDDLIDERRFDESEFLPYWAELWPSGIALARHVVDLDLGGKAVVELGCGLGLPSLAAAHAGADVLATDWAPEALALVSVNAAANGLPVRTALLDWRAEPEIADTAYDLVVAADVLYEERNAGPLLRLLPLLVAPGGEARVADPGRRHAPAFFAAAEAAWEITTIEADELPSGAITVLRRRGQAQGSSQG